MASRQRWRSRGFICRLLGAEAIPVILRYVLLTKETRDAPLRPRGPPRDLQHRRIVFARWIEPMSPALQSRSGPLGVVQPDAGILSGGSYQLAGGFWGGSIANYNIYLPLAL